QHLGAETVIGLDLVPERLERTRAHGVIGLDVTDGDVVEAVQTLTGGRGPDAVIDAVGMEAHGAPIGKLAQSITGLLPDPAARQLTKKAGVDRLSALHLAIELCRRGGTISLSGVYGGAADPMPLITMFDKQLTFRMGQANVKHWIDDITPLLDDKDVLGVESYATHRIPLAEAPQAYKTFQDKSDGAFKIVLKPHG
ncbi:MAG: zinc-binding dehydrogenase, partial [Solirubrobacteraceae bacterium]